jgi:alpha-tubulin suppressor-like RCC1 family protein
VATAVGLVAGCGSETPPSALADAARADGATDAAVSDGAIPIADAAAADAPGAACTAGGCGPGRFCSLPGGACVSAVTAVAAGSIHTCALHLDGRVSCWGSGPFIGPGLPPVTPPLFVSLPGRATALAVGIQAACAIHEQGGIRGVSCWGDFGAGPQGPRAVTREDGRALDGAAQITGGSLTFCAVDAQGVFCWGDNSASQLARPADMTFPPLTAVLAMPGLAPGATLTATVAVLVHDGTSRLCGWGNNDSGIVPGARGVVATPTCGELAGVAQLSAGDGHVCARRGGRAFSCWGSNSGGQLGSGDEDTLEAPLPGVSRELPADVRALAAGAYHTCALLEAGGVLCWGNNDHGECGVASSSALFAPVPVDAPQMVAIGSGAGAQHTCGVLADGSVACWGYDNRGQLGTGVLSEDDDRGSARPLPVRW